MVRCTASFGLASLRFAPPRRPLPSPCWAVIGPFPSAWQSNDQGFSDVVKRSILAIHGPEIQTDGNAAFAGRDGKQLAWQTVETSESRYAAMGVDFMKRLDVYSADICYAMTHVKTERNRTVRFFLGCDWWGEAFLNGERIISERPAARKEEDGAQFNAFKPIPATITLKKGWNTLLVKVLGGSTGSGFTAFLEDSGDMTIVSQP